MRTPKPTPSELQLRRENDGLKTAIVCLRREIENKQGAVGRLELLLHEPMEQIDQLVAQVDQLRHQDKKLDAEAEHLAQLVAAPQLNDAMLQKLDEA